MTTPEHRPGAPDYAHQQSTLKEHTQAQAFIDNKKQYDARFHALAAAIGSFAWTTTIDCQGLDMLGWSTYTGLPLAECQGNGWRKALHPADNELLLQEWKQAAKEHHVYNIACRIRRKDGHYSRCKVRTIPVFETDNEVTEWVWVANDLDEQPILEQDMLQKDATTQNSTRLLATAFETMSDGVFILDKDGRLFQVNAAGRALIGLDERSDFLFLPYTQRAAQFVIYDEQGTPLPPEQVPPFRILHGEVIPGSQAVDIRARTLDGQEMQLSIAGAPIRNSTGQIVGAVSVLRDVKERRRVERFTQEAMNALFQMVKILVSSANLGVAGDSSPIDGDAVIRQVAIMVHKVLQLDFVGIATHLTEEENLQPRTVVGSSQAEEEQWWQTITHSKLSTYVESSTVTKLQADKTCQLAPLWTSSNTGTQQRRLIVPLFAHGHFLGLIEVEYRESTLPEALDRQELLKAIGRLIALGIEQKNLLQERLEARANLLALHEANRRMNEFLGIASHELRTPMTSITLYLDRTAQLLKARPGPDDAAIQTRDQMLDKLQNMLTKAQIQMRRQHRLVNDLLDFSRIHNNWFNFQMEPCNLVSLVQDTIEEMQMLTPSRNIEMHTSNKEITIIADADRIRQVVSNYLSNALKYSPEDKPVWVHVQIEAGDVRVQVQDKGRGLSLDEKEHIWEQFYRTAQAGKQNKGEVGLGLGLHICRVIIEKHNGHVGVSSQLGVGSTFWFTLPTAPPE
jgi:signal transduction histidine kinase/PAS domain-containing protein